MKHSRVLLTGLLLAAAGTFAAAQGFHAVVEGGWLFSRSTEYRDVHPGQNPPVPLYGVGYRAAGDFGNAVAWGVGLGYKPFPFVRLDARFTDYPSLTFTGQSNFLTPPAPEPVRGKVHADSLLAGAYLDLAGIPGARLGRFRPYFGAGVGFSVNRQQPMVLSYPSLAVPHTLTTPGGTRADLAWKASVGFTFPLVSRLVLDLEYRYTHLGKAVTDEGDAVMVRPSIGQTTIIRIGETYTPLRFHGLFAGARVSF